MNSNAVFGRQGEQAVLVERLAAARRGEGSLVLVEGEGGAGKSALVSSLVAAARADGCPALFGRSWELSSSVPYEPFVAAISRFLRSIGTDAVARLTAGLGTLGTLVEGLDLRPPVGAPEAYKARLQDAIATLVARIGEDNPVVLVLDDFHWADQASLEVLQYLCLDLPDAPLVVALTVRPLEAEERPDVRRLIAALRRSAWTTSLALNRLDRAAIDAVVASRLVGEIDPRIFEAVASRSGGTPLFIHEMIDDLVSRRVVANASGVWRLLSDDVPVARSARDLIRTRLDRVEPHDRAVLESLAIINGPTDSAVVARLIGADTADVDAALERLRSNRLAVRLEGGAREAGQDDAWTIEHPIIAEVIQSELTPAVRRRLHRQLLEVDPHAPVGRRARHALLAGIPTDRVATVSLLADAGHDALARGAPIAAIEPLDTALSMLTDDDENDLRHRIERDLGTAHARLLNLEPALRHLRSAWTRAEDGGDVAKLVELLEPLDDVEFRDGSGGVSDDTLDRLRSAISAKRAWNQMVEVGIVLMNHAGRSLSLSAVQRALEAVRLIPSAARSGRARSLCEFLEIYPEIVGGPTRSCGAWVEILTSMADGDSAFSGRGYRPLLLALDHAMCSADRVLIDRCTSRLLRIEQESGQAPNWRLPIIHAMRSIAEGRLDEHRINLSGFGNLPRAVVIDSILRAIVNRYTEGPIAASAHFERSMESLTSRDRTTMLYVELARVMLALGTPGEFAAATVATSKLDHDVPLSASMAMFAGGGAPFARGLAATNETDRNAAVAALDMAGDGRWASSAWACVVRSRVAGNAKARAAELRRAAEILDGLGRSLEAAERTIDAAEADPGGLDLDRTIAAMETAREAGATWLEARARVLVPAGLTNRAARADDGPLSARECEVVALVESGLTNREIAAHLYISIRTVTSHLDHVYTKLALSSRHDLSAWWRVHA